jgi:hypothetical protein
MSEKRNSINNALPRGTAHSVDKANPRNCHHSANRYRQVQANVESGPETSRGRFSSTIAPYRPVDRTTGKADPCSPLDQMVVHRIPAGVLLPRSTPQDHQGRAPSHSTEALALDSPRTWETPPQHGRIRLLQIGRSVQRSALLVPPRRLYRCVARPLRDRGRQSGQLRVETTGRWGVRPATLTLVAKRVSRRQSA